MSTETTETTETAETAETVDGSTEEPTVQPTTERAVEPDVMSEDAVADVDSQGPAPIAAGLVDGEPPRDPAEENALLERWSKVQVFFVKDPRGAVAEADALITEVVEARRKAFDEHRASLADRWRESDADTEDLRLLMHDYRKIVNVLFPRQA